MFGMKPLGWPEWKATYSDGYTWTFVARHRYEAMEIAEYKYPGMPARKLRHIEEVK